MGIRNIKYAGPGLRARVIPATDTEGKMIEVSSTLEGHLGPRRYAWKHNRELLENCTFAADKYIRAIGWSSFDNYVAVRTDSGVIFTVVS